MPKNFQADSKAASVRDQRAWSIVFGICGIAIIATLALVMSGAAAHDAAMVDAASRLASAQQKLQVLERTEAPESSEIERVYSQAQEAAGFITAFERDGQAYDEAAKYATNLTPAQWFTGQNEGMTYSFSPSYRMTDGLYDCAWVVRDAQDRVIAYALAGFNADDNTFTIYDHATTVYARDYVNVTPDPVD